MSKHTQQTRTFLAALARVLDRGRC